MSVILIAIGSNLPHPIYGVPRQVCNRSLSTMAAAGITIIARSRWYRSAPIPASDQPVFINGLVSVSTQLDPVGLMGKLHQIENQFGRKRSFLDSARVLDLDLIAYEDILHEEPVWPVLPHPRMTKRAFVLYPLLEIAPDWTHPKLKCSLKTLISRLPVEQICIPDDEGSSP